MSRLLTKWFGAAPPAPHLNSAAPGAPAGRSRFETRHPLRPTVGLVRDLFRDPAQVAAVDEHLRPLLGEAETLQAIERDPVPIPAPDDREGYYGDRHLSYWLSGLADLKKVLSAPIPPAACVHVLELGGASGRVARHFARSPDAKTVTVAELNVDHVEWVETHFPAPGPVRAVKLGPYPHLPLADGSVTLCTAFSVFTHIDSYESGWLAEVHRVLAPGCHAYLTIHSEDTWSILPSTFVYQLLKTQSNFTAVYRPEKPMPEQRLVFEYNVGSIEYNCNVFHHSDYIRRRWGRWFEVVEIRFRGHSDQTVVLLRKR